MTLPEKVRDVTQSEWLEVRERLAEAASDAEAARMYAERSRRFSEQADRLARELTRVMEERNSTEHRAESLYTDAKRWNEAMAELAEAHMNAEQLASQLALAKAWGAEVCATLDWLTRDSGVTHSMVGAWLDEGPVALARETQRADRAEAERDEARSERDALVEAEHAMHMRIRGEYDSTIAASWRAKVAEVEAERDAMRKERDEAQRGRTSMAAVNAALRDYPDADVSALWVPASEALEYQGCWHRDVAKGRAAIEKRDADLAAARAQLSETVEALRLARNEILSGIDAEQLRITREIQEARREAERERDSLRAQLDSLLAKVTWMLTAPDFDRAAVERRVGLMPMTELHAIADAYIERVRAEERERCAVGAVVQMVRGE